MLKDFAAKQQIPFRYVLADSVYATNPDFLEAVESLVGVSYLGQAPEDTPCWLKNPVVVKKEYKYRCQTQTKKVLADSGKKTITFKTIARSINDFFWYRRKVSEGTKGPIEYEFTKRRVILAHQGLPSKTVWLLIRRTMVGEPQEPQYSYFISNAPISTRLEKFVWLSGLRWSIEQCFGETKTELGMDQYEVRKFPGWNHHIMTCMLAHYFLWHLKIRLGKKAPVITPSQLRLLLRAVLPMRNFDIEMTLWLIGWIQRRNHRAYLSHRKRYVEATGGIG